MKPSISFISIAALLSFASMVSTGAGAQQAFRAADPQLGGKKESALKYQGPEFENALKTCRDANPSFIKLPRGTQGREDKSAPYAFEACMSGKGFPRPKDPDARFEYGKYVDSNSTDKTSRMP